MLRRFKNVVEVGTFGADLVITNDEEAKGLIRVYQDYIKLREAALGLLKYNHFPKFNNVVLQPARDYLILNYTNSFDSAKEIDGQVIVGEGLPDGVTDPSLNSINRSSLISNDGDFLQGGTNNDLIIGESGDDYLSGEPGDDVIYAGSGNDFIEGGRGNDYLNGGDGKDIYFFDPGDGNDVIEDGDGIYSIVWDGVVAARGSREGNSGVYTSEDKKFTFNQQGADLVITYSKSPGDSITIRNFTPASPTAAFGIALLESIPIEFVPIPGTEENDNLQAQSLAYLQAGPGNDTVKADDGGKNRIDGGVGNDWLLGGPDNHFTDSDANTLPIDTYRPQPDAYSPQSTTKESRHTNAQTTDRDNIYHLQAA